MGGKVEIVAYLSEPESRPRSIAAKLWDVNWPLLLVTVSIAGAGIATLYSTAGGSLEPWASKQIMRGLAGLLLVFACAVVPLRIWMGLAWPTYIAAVLLLIGVALAGSTAMGARRWLQLGPLSLQPSEIAKVGLILVLARYYQTLDALSISRPVNVAVPLLLVAVPFALIVRQPDLGSAILMGGIGVTLMYLAGVSLFYFAGGAATVFAVLPFLFSRLHDYQRKRIETFLSAAPDTQGAGYHIHQSKIALGSGGLTGKGYMEGTQGALHFLPEKHTDFIFTMIGEEMGFFGAGALLAMYAVLLVLLALAALRCRSQFARLIIAGVAVIIFVHVFVNVGMVMGLMPVVGVPLPLVSYGGTSMIATLFALGLVMSAWVHRNERYSAHRRDFL